MAVRKVEGAARPLGMVRQARLLLGHTGLAPTKMAEDFLSQLDAVSSERHAGWASMWQEREPAARLEVHLKAATWRTGHPEDYLGSRFASALAGVDLNFWPFSSGLDCPLPLLAAMQAEAHRCVAWPRGGRPTITRPSSALRAGEIRDWRDALEARAVGQWPTEVQAFAPHRDMVTLATFADGARVVRLLTPADLDAEGLRMRHCLRSVLHYAVDAQMGRIALYSYRDAEGRPCATWEIALPDKTASGKITGLGRHTSLLQLQGPGNGPIPDLLARRRIGALLDVVLGGPSWRQFWGHRVDVRAEGGSVPVPRDGSWRSFMVMLCSRFGTRPGERHGFFLRSPFLAPHEVRSVRQSFPGVHLDFASIEGVHGETLTGLSVVGLQDLPTTDAGWLLTVVDGEWALVSGPHVLRAPQEVDGGGSVEPSDSDDPVQFRGEMAMVPDAAWWDSTEGWA